MAIYATLAYPQSGLTLNVGLYNAVGQIWNGSDYTDLSALTDLAAWRAVLIAAPELELSDTTGTATYQTGDISAAVAADPTCTALFFSDAVPTPASSIAQVDVGAVTQVTAAAADAATIAADYQQRDTDVTLPAVPPDGYDTRDTAKETTVTAATAAIEEQIAAMQQHGDTLWTTSYVGTGEYDVNHDFGGTDALAYKDAHGVGIDNAVVHAFLTSDYVARHRTHEYSKGESVTDVDGRWIRSIMLDANSYTIEFYKQDEFGPDTVAIVVPLA